MKKVFIYASVAVVLGVGVMLFPLWTFFRSYNEEGPIIGVPPYIKSMTASESWQNYTARTQGIPTFGDSKDGVIDHVGLQTQSRDASLQILAIGFIVAMVVYVVARRGVPRQTNRFWPYR